MAQGIICIHAPLSASGKTKLPSSSGATSVSFLFPSWPRPRKRANNRRFADAPRDQHSLSLPAWSCSSSVLPAAGQNGIPLAACPGAPETSRPRRASNLAVSGAAVPRELVYHEWGQHYMHRKSHLFHSSPTGLIGIFVFSVFTTTSRCPRPSLSCHCYPSPAVRKDTHVGYVPNKATVPMTPSFPWGADCLVRLTSRWQPHER